MKEFNPNQLPQKQILPPQNTGGFLETFMEKFKKAINEPPSNPLPPTPSDVTAPSRRLGGSGGVGETSSGSESDNSRSDRESSPPLSETTATAASASPGLESVSPPSDQSSERSSESRELEDNAANPYGRDEYDANRDSQPDVGYDNSETYGGRDAYGESEQQGDSNSESGNGWGDSDSSNSDGDSGGDGDGDGN